MKMVQHYNLSHFLRYPIFFKLKLFEWAELAVMEAALDVATILFNQRNKKQPKN